MSFDDPGWGGWTPPPATGEQDPTLPEAPAAEPVVPVTEPVGTVTAPPGFPPGQEPPVRPASDVSGPSPWWRRPVTVAIAIAAVVAIGAGVAVASSSGSSGPKVAPTTTPTTPTPTTVPTSSSAPTTVLTSTTPALLSKQAYITAADGICAKYKPQLDAATNAGDLATALPLLQNELAELRALGDPAQDAQIARAAFDNVSQAIPFLQAGDLTNANARLLAGDTLAGQFGMQVCNYGH